MMGRKIWKRAFKIPKGINVNRRYRGMAGTPKGFNKVE